MGETVIHVYTALCRYVMPVLALMILFRCGKALLTFRREPEIWAFLDITGGKRIPITHWENVIGRAKKCDVVLDIATVSRNHAVLTRYDDGSWTIQDADSSSGLFVNGKKTPISVITAQDTIRIGGVDMVLTPISPQQEKHLAKIRSKTSIVDIFANILLLTVFQLLCCIGYLLTCSTQDAMSVLLGFAGIAACQWSLLTFYIFIRRTSFEVETLAFYLCTLGMCAIAAVKPGEAGKQLFAMILGLCLFLAVGWSVRDLERAKKFRYWAAAAGIGLLVVTLLFGKEYYGAKNWLVIGSMSLQPSELAKVCFVYVGASAMDRLMNKRNLIAFIAYSVVVCLLLAVMNDFGTALIFFMAFLIIAFLRSGSVGTIALACSSVGVAGLMVLKFAPHAAKRFAGWRHIWEHTGDSLGYQQTRALSCIAAGGLLGLGAGKGRMKVYFAADSDVVIATLTEEWGLLIVLSILVALMILGLFAVRSAAQGRSSFYVIGACTAAGILLVQAILNVFGTVDALPFTGVTLPFVSNGGSSMISVWGLLAFIKAADNRQNASFAVPLTKKRRAENE